MERSELDENKMNIEIELSYEEIQGHASYLKSFREKIFPVYQRQGFSFPEAFHAWQHNLALNRLAELNDNMEDFLDCYTEIVDDDEHTKERPSDWEPQ